MSADERELRRLLEFAVEIARGAGEITLRHFREGVVAETKADKSFVTVADREAERFMRRRIEEVYPSDGVVGEEEGEREGTSGRRWILDPIDGTYSFVHGVPLYGVLVGLEIGDEPSVGVINCAALGEMVYAARGLGCFRNDGEPARVSRTDALEEALLLGTDFRAFGQYGFGEAESRLWESVRMTRTWGDCYGYLLVATGRAELMIDPVMNVWDCAALLPVMEEAGGTFTDLRGRRTIHGGNSIATNGYLFERVMEIFSARRPAE
ncbi:MAG TPA: inositol monophosphatase family protein [Pyrinomonadaceae bacterium]|nr:inositol monophosphatase family protein [Pyrinomonadaceae bacterium]